MGTGNGLVGIFDLRSQKPMVVKDHMYGSRCVKVWNLNLNMHDSFCHLALPPRCHALIHPNHPLRILDIKFHACQGDHGGLGGRRVISSDTHIVKIWDLASGTNYTSIEPTEGDINDVCVWPNSGERRRGSMRTYSSYKQLRAVRVAQLRSVCLGGRCSCTLHTTFGSCPA